MSDDGSQVLVAVGTPTRPTPYFEKANGEGIALLQFDVANERLSPLSITKGIDNPTYVVINRRRGTIYATSEVYGWNEGTVSAYQFDPEARTLAYVNKQATLGSITAHLALSRHASHLLATNFNHEVADLPASRSVACFLIRPDGGLAPVSAAIVHTGHGPRDDRQQVPHPHSTVASVDGDTILVADLGLDRIFQYRFDETTGKIAEPAVGAAILQPGSGPRHFVEAADGRFLYVVNELSSAVATFVRRDPYVWEMIDSQPTLPSGFAGENLCADIQMSADGRHLYASNRGHDSLACYALDQADRMPRPIGQTMTGGRTPRSFAFTPDGAHVLVANRNSDNIAVLRRGADGGLFETGNRLAIGTPMCIKVVDPT